jgi:hypothetical protein
MGFTQPASHLAAGELLPHHFALTWPEATLVWPGRARRYVSVALSLRSPSLDVIQHSALRSSDFPRTSRLHRGQSSIWDASCPAPHATNPEVNRRATCKQVRKRTCYPSCLVLLRMGFTQPVSHLTAGELLPHHFALTRRATIRVTLHILKLSGGMFLWHFP